jgi:hypothetical protein
MQDTMIISGDDHHALEEHVFAVATPLDAIVQLETRTRIKSVILAGAYAANSELVEFLHEFYPDVLVARAV